MARPRSIKPEELNMLTLFKVIIVKWKEHNPDITKMKGRVEFLKLKAARTTDTIDDEKFDVQGLFFAMLRHSAGGRSPGEIVAGSGEHLTLKQLARYLRKTVEELLPPLQQLMRTDRVKVVVKSSEGSQDEEPEEEPEEDQSRTSEKVNLYRACRVFFLAWEELHFKSYNRKYDKSQWDEKNLQQTLTPDKLTRFIAYAFHFHQQDGKVGIPTLEERSASKLKTPSLDNFLKRVADYSSTLRGEEWERSQNWSTEFLKKHQSPK